MFGGGTCQMPGGREGRDLADEDMASRFGADCFGCASLLLE